MLNWILFAVIGKFIIYYWMKFPLPKKIEKIRFFNLLHICDLCSGVWVYLALAVLIRIDLLTLWFDFVYIPALSEVVTAMATSYVVKLLSLGFKELHLNVVVI